MKRILFLIPCVFFSLLISANAGEIYTYTDKNGNTVLSNTPIPEEHQKKAKKINSYKQDSPEAIQRYEMKRQAKIQRQEDETRQRQPQAQQQRKTDDQKKKRAEIDKIEKEIEILNDIERSKSSDKRYMNSSERSANLRQAGYLKEKALMLRRSLEGVNEPQQAQKSGDTKSSSDFLPKVGKYRWEVE